MSCLAETIWSPLLSPGSLCTQQVCVEYPASALGLACKAPAPWATAESRWGLSLHPDLGFPQGRGSLFKFTAAQVAQNDGMNWSVLGVQFFFPDGTRMGKDSPLPVSSLLSLIDVAQTSSPQPRPIIFIFPCLLCLWVVCVSEVEDGSSSWLF